jgi:hypothetical protein
MLSRRSKFVWLLFSITIGIPSLSIGDQTIWPQFRGPGGDGIVLGQRPPVTFGEGDHVTWKTAIPGRGWSSPVVGHGLVWVTTAVERVPTPEERDALLRKTANDEKNFAQLSIAKSVELKLIAVDFKSGEVTQTIDLTTLDEPDAIHALNTYASPTPVLDGEFIYCHFGTFGTFCVNTSNGKLRWQRVLPLQHAVGPGSSPYVHGDLLVLIQDGMDRQYVTALDKSSGATVWEKDRPEMDAPTGDQKKAYCTPIAIMDSRGREQLICMSSQWLVSYEPKTGNEIWRLYHGKGFSVVPRPVCKDDVVYVATGFGKPQLWAVRVDGEGDVTDTHVKWQSLQGIPAKPSPVIYEGRIYIVDDNGVASCLNAENGEVIWKERLGGNFSASPLLAGGHLYFANHDGKVIVIQPSDSFVKVVENQLDGQIMASPAVVDNAMIWRTETSLYRFDK